MVFLRLDKLNRHKFFSASVAILFFLTWSQASFAFDPTGIFDHFRNYDLPALVKLITGTCAFLGFCFALRAVLLFKEYGAFRTMQSSSTSLAKPMLNLIVAIGLLYFPTLFSMFFHSIYGSTGIEPPATTGNTRWDDIVIGFGSFIQLMGLIGFIRGWILLTRIGDQGAQPGTLSKALIHIFAGILAVNFFGTWHMLQNIFAF
jgi:intracellular multiplication protein IcmC